MWYGLRLIGGESSGNLMNNADYLMVETGTSMKNAKELMLEHTAFSFRDPKKAVRICSSCMDRSSCDFAFTFISLVR
jgi:hypothetical protein